jgi:hypothetical protein
MSFRDLASRITAATHIAPLVRTTTPTTASFDRAATPVTGVMLLLYTGAGGITFTGTNKLEWILEDSDDNSNWTAVAASGVRGSSGGELTVTAGVIEAYVAAKAAASITQYEYIGTKRYVRVTPTFGGTHATGTMVEATIIGYGGVVAPLA